MPVDMETLEKFVDTFIEAEGQKAIRSIFHTFRQAPEVAWMDAMGTFVHWLNDPNVQTSSAAVHGVLMGMFAARLTEMPELKEKFFSKYFEQYARNMGENVESFMDHKIDKGVK